MPLHPLVCVDASTCPYPIKRGFDHCTLAALGPTPPNVNHSACLDLRLELNAPAFGRHEDRVIDATTEPGNGEWEEGGRQWARHAVNAWQHPGSLGPKSPATQFYVNSQQRG